MTNHDHSTCSHAVDRLRPLYNSGAVTRRSGFSLIEILAAMAILMMIVVIMGIVFRDANRSWALGTSRILNNTTGRSAISMIAQDLQYAVADDILTFYAGPDRNEGKEIKPPYDSVKWHEINFVSLQNNKTTSSDGDPLRTAVEVTYYIKEDPNNPSRYSLRRATSTTPIGSSDAAVRNKHCYGDPRWFDTRPSGGDYLADNVACLQFYCAGTNGQYMTTYNSVQQRDMLPQFVDIYLEILDDRAAKQLSDMAELKKRGVNPNPPGGSMEAFIEQNVKRYTKRVFFRNRHGYKRGR